MANIEQEIAQLEEQLAEKLQERREQGDQPEDMPTEEEVVEEIIQERIAGQEADLEANAEQEEIAPPADTEPTVEAPQGEPLSEVETAVQRLINVTFEQGIDEGIRQALKMRNAAVLDIFHDTIVDRLYQELLKRRKIKQVQ